MPRLERFDIEIDTGEHPGPGSPQYAINGFPLDLDAGEGSTAAGATFKASGEPRSFPHSLVLRGPDDGTWDIQSVRITYTCGDMAPYSVSLGAVSLDDQSDLNIWHEPPMPIWDV